jgi:membrane protein YdbS with pleckstrin-like domain
LDDRGKIAGPATADVEPAAESPGAPSPATDDVEDQQVDPRSVRVARLVSVPLAIVIPTPLLVGFTLAWAFGGISAVVFVLLVVARIVLVSVTATIAYRYPAARYRRLRYRVDPNGVGIHRGVIWRKTTWIPITRVQHTDVSQGPLQRTHDLATLTIYTAGTEGASIPLAGLEHGVAARLSDHLRPDRVRHAG